MTAPAARVARAWRRSLQTRVGVTTLVLSALVTALIGLSVLHQVRAGLLDARTRSALALLDSGSQTAAAQFDAAPKTDAPTLDSTALAIVTQLSSARVTSQDDTVALLSVTPGLRSYVPRVSLTSIPAALRGAVGQGDREAWSYTTIRYDDGTSVPGIVVGAPITTTSATYQLFYLFPLTQEGQALSLVLRTMLVASAVLVLLLVGIAGLVTRQVVAPVRSAARTAEAVAAGELDQRMVAKGEDDLARLAASFNHMGDTVQQQITQLQELSRVQRRFVADVSHELRTPLATIRMAADVLEDGTAELPPDLARSVELLQAQVDRFEHLLADLLEISRHDAGAAALDAEPMDLGAVVRRAVEMTEPLARRRGSALSVDLPAAALIIDADHRRVERVLRNLLANAVDHGEGRPVEVRVRGDERAVAVVVRDHGVGLRPGESSLVFGRFWRADPARARSTGGTGLGLSIALEDTRLHGGWLQAWGEPGRGSAFRLTLPWRAGDVVTASPLPLDPSDLDVQQDAGSSVDPVGATDPVAPMVTGP